MVLQHEGYSVYMQHHPSPTESISGFELFLGAGTEVWCLSGAYVCVLVLIVENLCVGGGIGEQQAPLDSKCLQSTLTFIHLFPNTDTTTLPPTYAIPHMHSGWQRMVLHTNHQHT